MFGAGEGRILIAADQEYQEGAEKHQKTADQLDSILKDYIASNKRITEKKYLQGHFAGSLDRFTDLLSDTLAGRLPDTVEAQSTEMLSHISQIDEMDKELY